RSVNDVAGLHGPPSSGGRGHLRRPRGRVASRQPRPREPRPAQGDERHRELPHGSPRGPSAHGLDPWGPCGALRGLRRYNDRLQQLPPSALSQVPGRGRARMDGGARGRAAPGAYFHVVFTLPVAIGEIAYHNKAMIYDLLFTASAETMLTIAADPKHLGARIGITSVLHSWGSAMTHHPHVHMIVPGGGLARDGSRWAPCKLNFCLPVRVLSKLFRRLMLTKLATAHAAGKLQFFGAHAHLADAKAFAAFLASLRKSAGSSMPSAHSPAQRPCSPICRATLTVSPSQIAV